MFSPHHRLRVSSTLYNSLLHRNDQLTLSFSAGKSKTVSVERPTSGSKMRNAYLASRAERTREKRSRARRETKFRERDLLFVLLPSASGHGREVASLANIGGIKRGFPNVARRKARERHVKYDTKSGGAKVINGVAE